MRTVMPSPAAVDAKFKSPLKFIMWLVDEISPAQLLSMRIASFNKHCCMKWSIAMDAR